jgi:hypothetical protein
MAVLRPHLALTVTDVERSIPWEVFATHEDVEEGHGGACGCPGAGSCCA